MKLSLLITLPKISFKEVAVFHNFTGRVDKLKLTFIPISTITYFASSPSDMASASIPQTFSNQSKHRFRPFNFGGKPKFFPNCLCDSDCGKQAYLDSFFQS